MGFSDGGSSKPMFDGCARRCVRQRTWSKTPRSHGGTRGRARLQLSALPGARPTRTVTVLESSVRPVAQRSDASTDPWAEAAATQGRALCPAPPLPGMRAAGTGDPGHDSRPRHPPQRRWAGRRVQRAGALSALFGPEDAGGGPTRADEIKWVDAFYLRRLSVRDVVRQLRGRLRRRGIRVLGSVVSGARWPCGGRITIRSLTPPPN